MCGIAGVLFHRAGRECPRRGAPAPRFTRLLIERLKHRGPDGHGVFVDDGVALVHTRLAMLDREHGAQPMSTPDGRFTLVVNGEIYNHRRLRPILEARGAQFRTQSDAEVLLWALALATQDAGAGAVDVTRLGGGVAIEGEYAFCLWDAKARSAIFGRDPLGVKPLVVSAGVAGELWFASEVKALRAVLPADGNAGAVDHAAVVDAFVAPALSGDTVPFLGVYAVTPGASFAIDVGGRTHGVGLGALKHGRGGGDVVDVERDIGAALRAAVADRFDADVPVGAFLSGGVDSSSIVAAAIQAGAAEKERLRCYSIRFDEGSRGAVEGSIVVGDDEPYTEMLAERWPIELVRVHASRASLVEDVENLFASQDRIVAWEQELTQRALAEAATLDVRAVVVGDAADETHFGYPFAFEAPTCHSPQALLERFGLSRRVALLRESVAARASTIAERAVDFTPGERFVADDGTRGTLRANRRAMESLVRARWLTRLLHNGDLHTMAFGVEARVPFADSRVVAAASLVDVDDAFVDDGHARGPEKRALRAAVAPWLPREIVERRKSALPRDEGMGPLWRELVVAMLADKRRRERVAEFLDLGALAVFLADTAAGVDDGERAILFSVIGIDGFLRHHAA
jgi:asparagine synthase (glutamine-hydrolysing)